MKKLTTIAIAFLMAANLLGCSSDDSSGGASGTLRVDGNPFNIGENTADIYNMVYHDAGSNYWQFHIIEKTAEGVEPSAIELVVVSEGTSINGTYPLYDEGIDTSNFAPGYAQTALNTPEKYYYMNPSSQTITVNDMGDGKYRLRYNNVTLKADDGSDKTLTGACEPTFNTL